jgi:transcriptional regulator with XRE-family HTH domain
MMQNMNSKIREEVRVALARRDMNQSELAEKIGVTRQYLSNYMAGKAGDVPRLWQRVFDELGLELVVQPKMKKGK